MVRLQKRLFIGLVVAVILLVLTGGVYAQSNLQNAEIAVLPASLERISWGAVLAGTVIALVLQLAGNLLAIGVGISRVNPNPHYGEDVPTAESIGTNTMVMVGVTMLVSLFIGGYVAARFAGSPDRGDAVLHGLMVWGLDIVITLFLLTTTIGTIFGGLTSLLGTGIRMIGSATSAVAQGAATVVQGAASAAGGVMQGAANAAGAVTAAAGDAAENAADKAGDAVQSALKQNPELRRLTRDREALMQRIQGEAMSLVSQAGVNPDAVKNEAQGAIEDAKTTVKDAARKAQQNPTELPQIVSDALTQLFQRGQEAAEQVVGEVQEVDRDKVVGVLAERANISREEAEKQLTRWEGEYNQLRQQGEQTMKQARQQAEQALEQAKVEAARLQEEARVKLEQARIDAERKAREVAEATKNAIARLALAGFAAIMIGAVAGGIGGIMGAPGTIPTVEILDDRDNNTTDVVTGEDDNSPVEIHAVTITPVPVVPTATP
jgi:ElaB/YqjD/DUF883 family membrane-anchored ribosome-binding protein